MENYKNTVLKTFEQGKQITCAKDDIIVQAGERPPGIQYIIDGFVLVYSLNDRGETFTHIVYGPGDVFPIAWIVHRRTRNIYYKAMTPCTYWKIGIDSLFTLLRTHPEISLAFLAQTIDHFVMYSDRVDNLVYKYARERLAYRLLYLASRFGLEQHGRYILPSQLNQQIIGSSINLSRESVSRELERLIRRGAVSYQGKQIVIENPKALTVEIKDTANPDWWGLLVQ